MKKVLLAIAALIGLTTVPMEAQRVALVATSEGTEVTTTEELATLADNGTPVIVWNNGLSLPIENSPNVNGELILSLYNKFQAGSASTNSQLWKLEKSDDGNGYRLLSLVNNKYLYMDGATIIDGNCSPTTTVAPDENTPETFTFEIVDSTAHTFYITAVNATAARGDTLYLDGRLGSSDIDAAAMVGWGGGGNNASYKILVPTVEEQTLYPVNYTYNFYDGSSNTLLADAGLTDLLPSEATGSYAEVQIGDTITLPSFSHTVVRNVMMGATQITDSASFCLTEEMVAAGTPTLTVNYTVNPRITFNCSMDLTTVNGAEGEYVFEDGGTITFITTRLAVGDTIVPPAIANFTALSDYNNETATVSTTKEAVYRPWRQIYLLCNYLSNGIPSTIRTVSAYVDIDSTITVPDVGEMYVYDQALTTENGGPEMPLTITSDNIFNGMQMELYYTRNFPLKLSELNDDLTLNEETATWYILRVRRNKIFTDTYNETYNALSCLADATVNDHTLWAITEATDGSGALLLHNKANPGKVFCDNSGGLNPPQLVDITDPTIVGFDFVNTSQNGYGIRITAAYATSENMILGDFGQQNYLAYWDDARAWDDPGCTVTFEEYKASNYTFLTGRSYLNAQDCIGGFTAEQLADVRAYVEEGDLNMEAEVDIICNEELRYDENRVAYNPDHVYAIVSAMPQYISRDNVQMALYASEDSVLSWKAFTDPTDKNFQFTLKQQVLQAADGTDSICYSFQHVGTGLYVNDNFHFNTSPGVSEEEAYYWAQPVAEVTDAEGNVTTDYLPAAFYVKKWVYYYWTLPDDHEDNYLVLATWNMFSGTMDAFADEGAIVSYNSTTNKYASKFRFKDLGTPAEVGIGSVVTDKAAGEGADKLYDLSGRQLQHEPTKGVYIKNGKTIIK